MDINIFRKEKISCAFSPTGMREINISRANTLEKQIQNYIVEVFDGLIFYMTYKYHERIDHGNNIEEVVKAYLPCDKEKFIIIAEGAKEALKEEIKTLTFNTKKEVTNYIFKRCDDVYYLLKNSHHLDI